MRVGNELGDAVQIRFNRVLSVHFRLHQVVNLVDLLSDTVVNHLGILGPQII